MKKIAFMFAAAALMVACGGAKTATQQQKDSIKQVVYDAEVEAAKAAIQAPAALAEGATAEDSAAYATAMEKYNADIAAVTVDSASEAFKAKVDEAIAAFEKTLNAPADTTKQEEQK